MQLSHITPETTPIIGPPTKCLILYVSLMEQIIICGGIIKMDSLMSRSQEDELMKTFMLLA